MATTSSIIVLLNFFSSKQKSATVDYRTFGSYLKKYSEHHIEEQPELVSYLGDPYPALNLELEKLVESKQVLILEPAPGKKFIYVIPYYIQVVAERYKDIVKNPALPFPLEAEMPKNTPKDILTRYKAMDFIYERLALYEKGEKPSASEKFLYNLVVPHEVPSLIVPSTLPVLMLLDAAFYKLRAMLYKEEFHDYFQKKVSISNPGKEIAAKNFFKSFVKSNDDALAILSKGSDYFYFWSQLCYFIRQDYDKVKDKTAEDISILQSLSLIEVALSYYKDKAQKTAQKESAFQVLESLIRKPPYYYSIEQISKFVDSKGQELTSFYTMDELNKYIHKKTTENDGTNLPDFLVFKVGSGQSYIIAKDKVLNLVIRLCSDARLLIRETIKNHWHQVLLNFELLPEMKTDSQFELRLEKELQRTSEVLYSILNSSFLPVISYDSYKPDNNIAEHINLFADGILLPYSQILLVSRTEMLSDARIMLPFWYSIPIVSWIAKLLLKKPKKQQKMRKIKTSSEIYREAEEEKRKSDHELVVKTQNEKVSKKVALHEAAREAESMLVPNGSTLDRELKGYQNQWNVLINKKSNDNLTEDVNSLIRDYMRKILRTMSAQSFTTNRIKSLAKSLVDTPSLQKIKDHDALNMYIQLYIVKLVKNIPT